MTCAEVVELVTDYLEGALSPDRQAAVTEHLRDCEPCLTYFAQIQATVRTLGTLSARESYMEDCSALIRAFRNL